MGWMDKVSAAATVAANQAVAKTRELAEELDETYGDDADYQNMREKLAKARVATREKYHETHARMSAADEGKKAGDLTRKFGEKVAKLPVLSLSSDAAMAANGVPHLVDEFVADPDDPMRAIWLAEGIGRAKRQLGKYQAGRSAISPTYALMYGSMKVGASLGDEQEPIETKLLKKAFITSAARVRENPYDADGLHVLSRVYLLQDDRTQAAKFSKLAIMADPDNGLPWITLARTYLAHGQIHNAQAAAQKAVDKGEKYGHAVWALAQLSDSRSWDDIDLVDSRRNQISPDDYRKYLGTVIEGKTVWNQLVKSQKVKAIDAKEKLKKSLDEGGEE